jgi:uncharacterized protein (DUF1778 family)
MRAESSASLFPGGSNVMAQATKSSSEPSRISLEVEESIHRLLQSAAAAHDQTVGQYVLEAIKDRLRQESEDEPGASAMMAAADPVLTELWDNPKDAEYDQLWPR